MAQRPSLLPLIIDMGIAPSEMLQEVQARQVIYGGSEELNLVEVLLLEEERLVEALGQASSLPMAAPGPLLVDRALTMRLAAAECDAVAGLRPDAQVVVSVQRADPEHLEDIRRILGAEISLLRASALRVEEARMTCLDRPLDPRVARTLDRWGSRLRLPVGTARPTAHDALTAAASIPPVAETSPPPAGSSSSVAASAASPDEAAPLRPLPAAFDQGPEEAAKRMRPMSNKAMPLEGGGPPSYFSVGETAPPPKGYEDVTARSGAKSNRRPALGIEYDLAQARKDLQSARSRDRIVEILVTLAGSHFDYAAAFGLHKSEARGLAALGQGAESESVKRLTVPLDLPSAFSRVQRSCKPEVIRLRASGMEGGISRDLARAPGLEVLLHPIVLRDRALLLLWCDQETAPPSESGQQLLREITPQVVDALTRLVLERKRTSILAQPTDLPRGTEPSPPGPSREPPTFTEPPPPDVQEEGELQPKPDSPEEEEDVTHQETSPRRPAISRLLDDAETQSNAELPDSSELPTNARDPSEAIGTERNPAAPPAARRRNTGPEETQAGPHAVAPARKRRLTHPQPGPERSESQPPASFPAEATRTLPGFPPAPSPAPHPVTEEPEAPMPDILAPPSSSSSAPRRPPLLSRRIVPVGKPAGKTKRGGNSPSAPSERQKNARDAREHEAEPPPRAGLEHIDAERTLERSGAPEFEAPHSTNFAAHASGARRLPPEAPLPDFDSFGGNSNETLLSRRAPVLEPDPADWDNPRVVSRRPALSSTSNLGSARSRSWSDLVSELLKGDETVIERLIGGGETAVGALIAEFPGPVMPPESPHEAASSCGPVLKALARIGAKATPFITVRTADEDAEVRRWATLLLGELPGRESARAIASRLLDTSLDVRRAALASARRVRNDALTRRMLRAQIEAMSRDTKLAVQERSCAIEALADIREHEAVPSLLMLLESPEPTLRRAARWALCVLTRQDFGAEIGPWQAFWQEHRDEDRVEWLISSLDHESRDIRRAAGEELRTLSGQDFGFNEDQGQAARRQAQASFRSWWTETGKAVLSGRSPGPSDASQE